MALDNPKQKKQLTNFELHPVRFLSMGNGILSFGFDGELYTMKEGDLSLLMAGLMKCPFLQMEKKLLLSLGERSL